MKYYLIFILLILVGCNRATNEKLLEFPIDRSFDNMGTFKLEGEPYIWFAKRQFNPCVKIYNIKGKELQTTNLSEAEKKLGKITRVWMQNTDTIFAYSNYINSLVILNKNGEIIEINSFDDREDDNGNRYEFYPPYGNISASRSIIFTNFLLKKENASFHGSWESFSDFSKEMKKGYLLYATEINRVDPNSRFGLRLSQLTEFPDTDSLIFFTLWQTLIVNNSQIFTSLYHRNIYLLNDDLTIRRIVRVIPDSIEIKKPVGIPQQATKEEEIRLITQSEKQIGAYINHIFYDDKRDIYIITLLENDPKTLIKRIRQIRVYDSDFSLKKTLVIENRNNYDGDYCFSTGSKIYIEKTDQTYDEKRIFEAFDL